MNRSARISRRRRVVVVHGGERAPFWFEHLVALIVLGLILVAGGIALLSLTEWGRATTVWLGAGLGLALTAWLTLDAWRGFRASEPASVVVGETLTAVGWGGMTVSLAAGLPFVFSHDTPPEWMFALPGAGAIAFTALAALGMRLQTRQPLPALDRTARTACVVLNADDGDGGQSIAVRYGGGDGDEHEAVLADLIDDSWRDRFAPGTTWQVYGFRDPELADTVVFLTETHDEVWRNGYKLDGVRLGGESGPVAPGPGSPFLRHEGKWTFDS